MIRPAVAADPTLTRAERLRGLLLGGAVGDALGAPVEFMRRTEILARFGPRGITAYAPAYGRLGAITDDTQMTLFTLEGAIRADMRFAHKGICDPIAVIDRAYLRWYATQTGKPPNDFELDGWLITVPGLHSQRAPGATCLSALAAKQWEVRKQARNDSKGAGGVMRVGPLGVAMEQDPYATACEVAALTHGHVTGQVAAGWFARWIHLICNGASLEMAARSAAFRCREEAPELSAAIVQAQTLAEEGQAEVVPAPLGQGWIAEEAAAIALWCVLTAPDPFEALRLAVNIDGDSDTTGSLVGQVLGASLGTDWIPPELLQQLELVQVIEQLAADAAWMFWGGENAAGEVWNGGAYSEPNPSSAAFWERYPGW